MTRSARACKVIAVSTPNIPILSNEDETPPSGVDAYQGPEQPTLKRPNPLDESEPPAQRTTTKMKKAEIEALVRREKDASGMRRAVSDEEIADYEQKVEARK